MLPGCSTPDSGAQTDPSLYPVPLLPKEKQPPAQHPAVPAPDKAPRRPGARARRAHAPSRLTPRHLHKQGAKHPRAHAPGTRRHRRAASPQRLVRARAHEATRGHIHGPLPPQGPRGRPSAPLSAGRSVGAAFPAPSPMGVRCQPLLTPLRLSGDDPRLQHPLPLRGPDRPRFPSSPSWPAHLAQVRSLPRLGPADTHLSSAALSWALRVSPAAPRTRAPRPAHLPESGRGGNG